MVKNALSGHDSSKVNHISWCIGAKLSKLLRQRQYSVSYHPTIAWLPAAIIFGSRLVYLCERTDATLALLWKFEEAKKEAEKEGVESKNMEAVNMEISSRLSEIFQEIENATDATLAGYMDGFSSRQIKWYVSPHGDEVKKIRDAIQRRLESKSEREQNEFFDQQGADRNLWDQWTATSALFDETKRSVSRYSGQSSSYSSFADSLITLSLGYDGRSLISGSTDRATGAG